MRKKYVGIFIIAIAIGVAAASFMFRKKDTALFETIVAARADIVAEVASTGRVQPTEIIELAFESGGRVKSVSKRVGSKVFPGEILLMLDASDLYAQKAQADASLRAAQAALAELTQGIRPEELEIKKVALENAERAFDHSLVQLLDAVRDAYMKADDAVRNRADELFSNPRTTDPVLTTIVQNNSLRGGIEQKRVQVEEALKRTESVINGTANPEEKSAEVKKMLVQVALFLDRLAFAINNDVTPNSAVSHVTIDTWRGDIAAARGSISGAQNNMTGAEQGMSAAVSVVHLAKSEIAYAEAGTDKNKIRAQEATIEGAEAQVSALIAKIEKTAVRTPIGGIISKQDVQVGEMISAFSPAVTIFSAAEFEIETFIPEADISFVRVGLPAHVTLDAYTSDDVFSAKVAKIDPAETLIEGVPTYKVTLVFLEKDERIRSGMTANITIESDKRESVLTVPMRAVVMKEGKEFVRVARDKTYEEVFVTTGLRGSNGMIEITGGIEEGDVIVTFVKDESDSL